MNLDHPYGNLEHDRAELGFRVAVQLDMDLLWGPGTQAENALSAAAYWREARK